MKNLVLALLSASLLSGCCMFFPCHPGLWAYGRVTRAGTEEPVVGASVSVFGTTIRTSADGCFKLQLADALPFKGYEVRRLKDGFPEWKAAGLEVETA